jgi:hypothetical protein
VLWVIEKDPGGQFDRKSDVVGKAFDLLVERWITRRSRRGSKHCGWVPEIRRSMPNCPR